MAWPDALLVVDDLLADPEVAVRAEAARALCHLGSTGAVALLRFRLGQMVSTRSDLDETEAVMHALLHADFDAGLNGLLAEVFDD